MTENNEQGLLIPLLDEQGQACASQRGCKRFMVDEELWTQLAEKLGGDLDLLGLWADAEAAHMALYAPGSRELAIVSIALEDNGYPSVGALHAAAIRPERTIRDLLGVEPRGLPDTRLWLDHGAWELSHPLKETPDGPAEPAPYAFLPSEGEGLHQVPVGPVHAGIIEPGHFRFTCAGETVVRLEERLGYTHKGIEKLLEGKTPEEAAPIAARISGDSTVAYSLAFARAVEAALEADVPARAVWLRALMAEMERLANHLGDIGAVCNDAAFALLNAHFGLLREEVLQTAQACFGHRLMMDKALPGGVAADLTKEGRERLAHMLAHIHERLPRLVEVYDNTPSLQDRTRKTGWLDPALAKSFAPGGFIGRAAGRAFDVRACLPFAPYDELPFKMQVLDRGDVDARVWIRIKEAQHCLELIEHIVREMPEGGIMTTVPAAARETREGLALAEAFRGDVLIWLRLDAQGRITRCHARDASVFQWPLLEAVIHNNIIADFPLCNKSFNCSYSGHDL